jgi:hypothetical protein
LSSSFPARSEAFTRFIPASTTAIDKKADGVANSDTDTTEMFESTWVRCYDFKNTFAHEFGENVGNFFTNASEAGSEDFIPLKL